MCVFDGAGRALASYHRTESEQFGYVASAKISDLRKVGGSNSDAKGSTRQILPMSTFQGELLSAQTLAEFSGTAESARQMHFGMKAVFWRFFPDSF
jgi:hypothetical protein